MKTFAIMSTIPSTTELRTPGNSPDKSFRPFKSQRILACVLCQQRKVKCSRKFPCENCTKSKSQCVPAAPARRQRKRRFPERALLDRLRQYEDLLRRNKIAFEPLHRDSLREKDSPNAENGNDSDDEDTETAEPGLSPLLTTVKSESRPEAKYALLKQPI